MIDQEWEIDEELRTPFAQFLVPSYKMCGMSRKNFVPKIDHMDLSFSVWMKLGNRVFGLIKSESGHGKQIWISF